MAHIIPLCTTLGQRLTTHSQNVITYYQYTFAKEKTLAAPSKQNKPSPRSITSLPADWHLAGAPFRALAKLLEVYYLPRLVVNPRNETIDMLTLLFRIPVAKGLYGLKQKR